MLNVELLGDNQVAARLNKHVARAEARYAPNPTPKNAEAPSRARQDVAKALSGGEALMRGARRPST